MGKYRGGCVGIVLHRIITFFEKTVNELPALIVAAVVLTLAKKYFFVAVIGATAIF